MPYPIEQPSCSARPHTGPNRGPSPWTGMLLTALCILVLVVTPIAMSSAGAAEPDQPSHDEGVVSVTRKPLTKIIRRRAVASTIEFEVPLGARILDVNVGLQLDARGAAVKATLDHAGSTVSLLGDRFIGSLGANEDCDGGYAILDDEGLHDVGRFDGGPDATMRPVERLDAFTGQRVRGAWTLTIQNQSLALVDFNCMTIRISYMVPGSGVYAVTTTADEPTPAKKLLSLREAMTLSEVDGMDSVINLPADATFDLGCDQGLVRRELFALVINGNQSTVKMCASERILMNSAVGGSWRVNDLTIGGGRRAVENEGTFSGRRLHLVNGEQAILNRGTLTLHDSVIARNEARVAVVVSTGRILVIEDSRILDNAAGQSIISVTSPLSNVTNSVIAGNRGFVGAVHVRGGTTLMSSVTLDSNSSLDQEGVGAVRVEAEGSAELIHVTALRNASPAISGARIAMFSSVVVTSDGGPNCAVVGTWETRSSASDDDSCNLGASDIGVVDPMFKIVKRGVALPRPGSPLIDVSLVRCAEADVRGFDRPQGPACDAGSVERVAQVAPTPVEPTPTEPGPATTPTPNPPVTTPTQPDPAEPSPGSPVVRCGGRIATIVGTPGHDIIRGTSGNDVIAGLGGNDIIRGLQGHDIICGGYGHDVLIGGYGHDRILGGRGADLLKGGPGRDHLSAGFGNDRALGGKGADELRGGGGSDVLNGGPGRDRCAGGVGVDQARMCERRTSASANPV